MIDNQSSKSKFKSLTAETDLHNAYEYIAKGDLKQCKKLINQKLQKLKNPSEILNFKIIKLLYLIRSKQTKEANALRIQIKDAILKDKIEILPEILNIYKEILIELSDFATSSEINKFNHSKLNLATISKETQENVLRELFTNYDFKEIYTKVSSLSKNPNADAQFLFLIKLQTVYFMVYKYASLPKSICNSIIKDMIANFDKYSTEKGFCDIFINYLLVTNDHSNFLKYFEVHNPKIYTNAPIDDLKMEVYYLLNDHSKCLRFILETIYNNIEKCNYSYYERAVNITLLLFKDNLSSLFEVLEKGLSQNYLSTTNFENLVFDKIDAEFVINLFYYFNHIKEKNLKSFFNAYKSGVLAQLNLLSHLIVQTKKLSSNLIKVMKNLLIDLLVNIPTKQSVLMEAKKFFIFLSKEYLFDLFKQISDKLYHDQDKNDIEKIIFIQKIELCTGINPLDSKNIFDYLSSVAKKSDELMKLYLEYTNNNVVKLEKGERLVCDDLVILIMELFFRFYYHVQTLGQEEYLKVV